MEKLALNKPRQILGIFDRIERNSLRGDVVVKISLKNKIQMGEEVEYIHEVHEGEWLQKGGYDYLLFTNSEKEKVVIKFSSVEMTMTRFSTPKTIMRFLEGQEAVVTIPTPLGIQHFVTQTDVYQVDLNQQCLHLSYRLKGLESQEIFADYEMKISWI